MSLTERNRAVLYQKLTVLIDDEEAVGDMLSNLTALEADQVATKDFVRAEVNAAVNRLIVWMVGTQFATIALVLTITRNG